MNGLTRQSLARRGSASSITKRSIISRGGHPHYTRMPDDQQARWHPWKKSSTRLARIREEVPKQSGRSAFLDDIALSGERDDSDDKESQLARNAIALMTLHSAKGLEFPQVYLVGWKKACCRTTASVGGRRGVRSMKSAGCVRRDHAGPRPPDHHAGASPQKWGKPQQTHPSRFLFEMTGQAEKAGNECALAKPGVSKNAKAASLAMLIAMQTSR